MRRGNLNANSFYNIDNREIVVTLWVFCTPSNARTWYVGGGRPTRRGRRRSGDFGFVYCEFSM